MKESRAKLIEALDVAAVRRPGDAWIAGQQIRFSIDQQDTAGARRRAASCTAEGWWCSALRGQVAYVFGDAGRAESYFKAALRDAPRAVYCEWTDLSQLLDPADALALYDPLECGPARDSLNERIWWLADPLLTHPGNPRWVEHVSRHMLIALRSEGGVNERWEWDERYMGDAIRAMIVRYGWPSFSEWGGFGEDWQQYAWRAVYDSSVMRRHLFATALYSAPRYHTFPDAEAIADPLQLSNDRWLLWARLRQDTIRGGAYDRQWWSREHAPRDRGPLIQLGEQHAFLRRGDSVLLVTATAIPDTVPPLPAVLFNSREPGHLAILGTGTGAARLRLDVAVPDGASGLFGVELTHSDSTWTARTRFGAIPPPPLRALHPDSLAISDLVMLEPSDTDVRPDTALRRMATSNVVRQRVPIYWETYGLRDSDSVTYTITLRSVAERRRGLLGSVLAKLGFGQPLIDGTGVTMVERVNDRLRDGPFLVSRRVLTLNLAGLAPGEYYLAVEAQRGAAKASSPAYRMNVTP